MTDRERWLTGQMTKRELYIDYVNNFKTLQAFASYYNLSLEEAKKLTEEQRAIVQKTGVF